MFYKISFGAGAQPLQNIATCKTSQAITPFHFTRNCPPTWAVPKISPRKRMPKKMHPCAEYHDFRARTASVNIT